MTPDDFLHSLGGDFITDMILLQIKVQVKGTLIQ